MKAQQQRTRFDTRSVMLFAAISLGGAGALQAQGQTSSPSPQFGPSEKSAPQAAPKFSSGPGSNSSPLAATPGAHAGNGLRSGVKMSPQHFGRYKSNAAESAPCDVQPQSGD